MAASTKQAKPKLQRGKYRALFAIVLVLAFLPLLAASNDAITSHSIRLHDGKLADCLVDQLDSPSCPICNTINLPPGYIDKQQGFPFVIEDSTICPGPANTTAEVLDSLIALVGAVAVATTVTLITHRLQSRRHADGN